MSDLFVTKCHRNSIMNSHKHINFDQLIGSLPIEMRESIFFVFTPFVKKQESKKQSRSEIISRLKIRIPKISTRVCNSLAIKEFKKEDVFSYMNDSTDPKYMSWPESFNLEEQTDNPHFSLGMFY